MATAAELERMGVQVTDLRRREARVAPQHWSQADPRDYHTHLSALLARLEQQHAARRADWLRYARLYTRRDIQAFRAMRGTARAVTAPAARRATLSLNVVKSCIDTVAAKIAKSRPKAMFLTSGADYKLREAAKGLTKFVGGVFEEARAYEAGQRAFVDACVVGLGCVSVFVEGDAFGIERVFPDELRIDDEDARDGRPTEITRVRPRSRAWLLARLGDDQAARRAVLEAPALREMADAGMAEHVEVRETFRVASGDGVGDGIHCLTIEGATLWHERWPHPWLPFAFVRWSEDPFGFFGIGLAEELFDLQLEIAKTMRHIARAVEGAVPRVFIEGTSSVAKSKITDEIWSLVEYTGAPPTFSPAAALSGEVYSYLESLIRKAYEITGVSMLSAQSRKPAGVTANVALRTLQDVESERFALVGQRYEQLYLDIARIVVDMARGLSERVGGLRVKVRDGKNVAPLDFRDIDLEKDKYLIDAYPVSRLPTDPAGRLEYITELMSQGIVASREEALELLDWPDVEGFVNVATAGVRTVQRVIAGILDDGVYRPPTEIMPLAQAVTMAQAALLEGEDEGRPEARLSLLQQWLDAATVLERTVRERERESSPAAPAAPGMVPPGVAE
jgi:hypothetical protein